jgi:hypothetical protein
MILHKQFKFSVVLCFIIFLQACATPYTGHAPDLTLRGDSAKAEYKQFKLQTGYFSQGNRFFEMGSESNRYTESSLRPILESVSPRAMDKIKTADGWRAASLVSLAGMVGVLVASIASNSSNMSGYNIPFYSLFGVSIACTTVQNIERGQAADYFNEDLKSKLEISEMRTAPRVQVSFRY